MKVGEVRKLSIPADEGYGANGFPGPWPAPLLCSRVPFPFLPTAVVFLSSMGLYVGCTFDRCD